MNVSGSQLRRLGLAGAWLLLTAARQEATPMPDMLLPGALAHPAGSSFTVDPGDEVLRGKIVKSMVIKLTAPFTATLDRFSHDFKPGDELTPVLLRPGSKGEVRVIFCGPDQRAISKFTAAMMGDWFSKFESIVRFCFVDDDNDGKFEGFILAGAKDPALQSTVKIEPTPYSQQDLAPYPGESDLRIIYRKFDPDSQRMVFGIEITVDGKPQRFDFLNSLPRGTAHRDSPTFHTDPAKVPYPSHFGNIVGADLGIRSVDAASGEAQMAINANFAPTMIKPVQIHYQYIYVYVYR